MQTTVLETPVFGCPGDIADLWTAERGIIDSATSEEASAEIPFGVMLQQGTGDDGAKLLGTSAAAMAVRLLGIAVRAHDFAVGSELGTTGLKPGATFGCGKKGRFKVLVEDAVTPLSHVRVRAVAAGAEVKGAFRALADGTDCVDISAFAKWRTSAGIGEVAVVEIDMANAALAVADT